jgi:TANFOR domain-containing protein
MNMKMLHLAWLIVMCLYFSSHSSAQSDVLVNVQILPPFSPYLSTYVEQPNKIKLSLQNTTTQQKRIKLWVQINGDNGVSGRTAPSFLPPQPIVLNPGEFKMIDFSSNETRNYFDPNRIDVSGISKNELIQNQALPEGNYTICVRALDYTTGLPLSAAEPGGCSAPFPIFYIDPPVPVQPNCGSEIMAAIPQNVVFSWTPPATAPGNIKYEFTLKEVPATMSNHFDVIKNPAFASLYSTTITATTTLVYTNNLPQLQAGKKYVWRVRCIDPSNKVQFKNQGFSDACVFIYKKSASAGQNTPQLAPQVFNSFSNTQIPVITIQGKLQWAFRKEEEANNLLNYTTTTINLNDQVIYADVVNGVEITTGNLSTQTGNLQKGTKSSATTLPPSNSNSANANSGFFFQGSFASTTPGNAAFNTVSPKPSQFQITQSKIDAVAGSRKYPLKKIQVKLILKPKQELLQNWQKQPKINGSYAPPVPKPVVIGTTYTNNDGEFSINFFSEIAIGFYELDLEIGSPHFIFADVSIPLQQVTNNVYSIGTLNGVAKTFRLQVKNFENVYVKSKNTFVKGDPINDVNVRVYHPKSWNFLFHPNQLKEGLRVEMGIENSLNNPEVARTKGSQQIPRLFANTAQGGHLMIEAEAANYNKYKSSVNINENSYPGLFDNYLDKPVPVVTVENLLIGSDPVLKGKVLVEGLNTPVKGATVNLLRQTSFGQTHYKITTTNDHGEFEIQGIKAEDKPYLIKISHGSLEVHKENITLNKAGTVTERIFYVKGRLIFVSGTVKDIDGNVMKDAVVRWKSGGSPSSTNDDGKFLLSNIQGKHILIAKKPGFKDTEIEVEVKEPLSNLGFTSIGNFSLTNSADVKNFMQNINMSPSLGNIVNGVQAQGVLPAQFQQQISVAGPSMQTQLTAWDVGTIVLKRFYLKLKVTDHDNNNPIADAKVECNGTLVGATNSNGETILGNISTSTDYGLIVHGPKGSSYVSSAHNIVADASIDTSLLFVKLKKGSKVSGKVTAGGNSVKQATIYVEGSEYLKTETDDEGKYSFALPTGEHTLWATKSGYVGESKKQNVTSGEYTVNFNLKDAGFDATKILGFDVQLIESNSLSNNEYEISGHFVNIPSNAAFKSNPALKLPFSKQKVKILNGVVTPTNGEIQTDVSQLPIELWGFLKLKLSNPTGLRVKPQQTDNTKGKIEGEIEVDVANTFAGLTGIDIPAGGFKLTNQNISTIPAFTSDGSLPFSDTKLNVSTGNKKWKIHELSLTLDAANTFVSKEGIDVKGSLITEGFKYLSGLAMNIQQMTIAPTGDIKNLKVSMNPKPSVNIQSWELGMSNIDISAQGLKLDGVLKMAFSGSNLHIDFNKLNLTKSALSGGTFSISGNGLPLFSFLKAEKNGEQGLTLQILPDGKNFNLTGNVNFSFNKLLKTPFKVDEFGISTTGNIAAKINTEKSVGIADIATFKIKNLGINTAQKQVDLGGGIVLDIGNFAAQAATKLKFNPGGVSMDDFAFALSLGGIGSFGASASFNSAQERFAGSGKLSIASSPLEFGAGFVYSKVEFGANFNMAPSVKIPCGAVNLDKIGGGFNFNKAEKKFKVWGQTRVAFAADPSAAINLDPTTFAVTVKAGGPIFEISGQGNVVGMAVGNAKFTLDIPARLASLTATAGASFNKIPGVSATGNVNILAEVGFGNSPYLFFGQAMNIKVIDLCNSSGGIAVAANYNVPASVAEMYKIPMGKFTGFASWSTSHMGIPKEKALGFDVGVASAKFWASNRSEVRFFCQLNGFNAGFNLASGWDVGASACFIYDLACIGLGVSASGALGGQLDAGGIKSASAQLSGSFTGHFGCCDSQCGTKICWWGPFPCGGKLCVNKTIYVNYNRPEGFSFSL